MKFPLSEGFLIFWNRIQSDEIRQSFACMIPVRSIAIFTQGSD